MRTVSTGAIALADAPLRSWRSVGSGEGAELLLMEMSGVLIDEVGCDFLRDRESVALRRWGSVAAGDLQWRLGG